jgi:Fe-S cluster biogenesis protein NfuA
VIDRINSALREFVAPELGLDPAELVCTEYLNGIASVRLGPACHSCSGTLMTLVLSIENELRTKIPDVEIVEIVS